jgi:hypothetical protein
MIEWRRGVIRCYIWPTGPSKGADSKDRAFSGGPPGFAVENAIKKLMECI